MTTAETADRPVFHPELGQSVHYVSHGSRDGTYPSTCRAAVVTEVGGWVPDDRPGQPAPGEGVAAVHGAVRLLRQRFDAAAARLLVANPGGLFTGDGDPHPYDGGGSAAASWHRAQECPRRLRPAL